MPAPRPARPFARGLASISDRSPVIDGEMVVLDETGRASFRSQRSVIMTRPALLVLVVFDLLHLNGSDLREQPAEEPRRARRDLVTPGQDVVIQFSQELPGLGPDVFAAADRDTGSAGRNRTRLHSGMFPRLEVMRADTTQPIAVPNRNGSDLVVLRSSERWPGPNLLNHR